MNNSMKKTVRGFFIGAIVFLILIPLIIIGISYLPNWMIKLAADTPMEYFKANVLNNLGLKLIIATFVSCIITSLGSLLVFKLTAKDTDDEEDKDI